MDVTGAYVVRTVNYSTGGLHAMPRMPLQEQRNALAHSTVETSRILHFESAKSGKHFLYRVLPSQQQLGCSDENFRVLADQLL